MNIAINGIGRIGKGIFRYLADHPDINIKLINDINKDIKNIAYILQYDTIHGKFKHRILVSGRNLKYNNKVIKCFNKTDIDQVDLKKEKIETNVSFMREQLIEGLKRDILVLDLTNYLKKYITKNTRAKLYWDKDGHYTPLGYEVVSKIITNFLNANFKNKN